MINVGINGFGRIGRIALRVILARHLAKIKLAAINNPGPMEIKDWAHLFKYDSVYGQFKGKVEVKADGLVINHQQIAFLTHEEPAAIPWKKYGVDVVIESSGIFRDRASIRPHLQPGVKKVVVSATAKQVKPFVMGVNETSYQNELMVSNASCTTNCAAPLAMVVKENFGVQKAMVSTIHAYTADQNLVDSSHHKDLRRARAAGLNIVPTSTGAAKTTMEVLPDLKGIFDGLAFRVPVACVSMIDLTMVTTKRTTVREVNQVLVQASQAKRGIIQTTDKPLVSSDVIGCNASALVDLNLTQVVDGDLIKIVAWYDNEWGYCCRLAELTEYIMKKN